MSEDTIKQSATMASHLQPFTPPQVQNTESKFHNFPQLPKELRDRIWHTSIQHTQIFHLHLYDLNYTPAPTKNTVEKGHLANGKQDQPFFAVTDEPQTKSKLFDVNRESREAALSFYRVRIPCWFRSKIAGGGVLTPGTLYFHPDHDFLRITAAWSVKNTLFPFLHLLNTNYDPLHVGLRNLIIGVNDLSNNDLQLTDPSTPDLDVSMKETFSNILKNIHQVFFYSTVTFAGRQIFGQIKFALLTNETKYNRSIPIQVQAPIFDRLVQDPRRAIGEDLKGMYVGNNDPQNGFRTWNAILEKWNLSLDIQYKWCIAYQPPEGDELFDRKSARKFMQKEDDLWNAVSDPDSPTDWRFPDGELEIGALTEKYKDEDLERAVRPAFGFWVFPMEVLGSLEEEYEYVVLRDLTSYWPELWLASLPDES